MKVHILINDKAAREGLIAEHGFSCLVEYEKARVLFDMGDSDAFIRNADTMGVDVFNVTHLMLSHAHYDHTGGLMAYLLQARRRNVPILAHSYIHVPKYWEKEGGVLEHVGNRFVREDFARMGAQMRLIGRDVYEVCTGLYVLSSFSRVSEFEHIAAGARAYVRDEYKIDTFKEELVLAADTEEGLVLVTGCSHSGIINICEKARNSLKRPVRAVIGGTHLIDADERQTEATTAYFNAHPELTLIAPMHCTGDEALARLEKDCKAFCAAGAGSVLALD